MAKESKDLPVGLVNKVFLRILREDTMSETTARYDVRVDSIVMIRGTVGKKNGIPNTERAVVVKNGESFFEIPYEVDGADPVHGLVAEGLSNMREMGLLSR